jgi:hypothetical protein
MSQIHEAKGSRSKLHCRKRRVINLKSQCSQQDFPESRKEHFATQTVSVTKATEHHKTINYLGYFQSFKENVQVTFWFCNQQNLENNIHS